MLLLTLVFFACCDDGSKVEITREEYLKLKGDTLPPDYPKIFRVDQGEYKIYLGSDGHEYYKVYIRGYHPFHYPDCVKCLVKDSVRIYIQTEE